MVGGGGGWMNWWMDVCEVFPLNPVWQLELAVSLQRYSEVETKLDENQATELFFCFQIG